MRRHAVLTEQVAELQQLRRAAGPRLAVAQAAADKIAELTRQVREAELVAAAAAATNAASAAAHSGRLRLVTEIATRTATIAATEAEEQEAVDARSAARADAEAADAAVEEAAGILALAQQRVEIARSAVGQLASREEADRLTTRLAKIDTIQRDRDRICAELSAIVLTEELLQRIEKAAAAVDRTGGQLALMSAAVDFTAAADIELTVGDQRVSLPAGGTWSTIASAATGATEVEVVGVVTARVTPGATALDVQAKHAAAQQELAAALAAADVADLAAARSGDQRRRELQGTRDQLSATLAGLCGDEDADEVRARLAQLRAGRARVRRRCHDRPCRTRGGRGGPVGRRRRLRGSPPRTRLPPAPGSPKRALGQRFCRAHWHLNVSSATKATEQLAQERESVSDEDLAAAADAGAQAAANRPAAGRRAGR